MQSLIDFLASLSSAIPWPILWLGACLGHAFWMTVGLNVLYAYPLPHQVLRFTRKIDILTILSGPLVFFLALDPINDRQLNWHASGLRQLLAPYTMSCFFLGTVVGPICQIRYWLRKTAPQQVQFRSTIIDFAEKLGYQPIGHAKDARLCQLPGNQVFQVEFSEKTLLLPQIPAAWDGLTILHLTDLHFIGSPDRAFYQALITHLNQSEPPDLLALTGDVVDSKWHHRWVVPLLGRLRWKDAGFAILGNHDHYQDVQKIRRRLCKANFRVLANSWQEITIRGERMVVIGDESPWLKPRPNLCGCPEKAFRLCLSHTPDTIAWARKNRIDLMLAGHVHGGQIRFPLIGSTFCPSRYSRRYDAGTFDLAPTLMHVCRGVAGQHPLRCLCRPEVTKIILRKS